MTKKDYVLLALTIADTRATLKNTAPLLTAQFGVAAVLDTLITNLCTSLAKDNPNFDSDKFREACYGYIDT